MSVAGYIGEDSRQQADEVRKSLLRLMHKQVGPSSPQLSEYPHCVIGSINEGSLFHHLPTGISVVCSGVLFAQRQTAVEFGLDPESEPAEIATAAFLRHGIEFADKLYGEFALLLWVPAKRQLLLVRDGMKRSPLFYAPLGRGFIVASEPRGLLGWRGFQSRLDDRVIAAVLAAQALDDETIYHSVRSAPGAVLILSEGSAPTKVEHWHPLSVPQRREKDWREYAQAIFVSMRNAVSVRLPEHGTVASQLSSGFDSSSVTALVAQALAEQNRPLLAYTSVPVQATNAKEILSNRFADEWPLAAEVAARYPNLIHIPIPTNAGTLFDSLDASLDYASAPPSFIRNSRWFVGILRDAQSRGAHAMFEGQAGNLTGSYNGSFGLYDLRKRGQWRELLRAFRNRVDSGSRLLPLIKATWMPGARANFLLQRLRGKPAPRLFDLTLMRESFYHSSGLVQNKFSAIGNVIEGDRSSGPAWRYSLITAPEMGMMTMFEKRGFGLDRHDPTADRRVVETVLSIPDEAFAPNGIPRELYREAFRQHLPSRLLAEPLRGLQSSDFLHHFRADLPAVYEEWELMNASALVNRYLDMPRMRRMLDDFDRMVQLNRGFADQLYNYTVGGALALGRLVRRFEDGSLFPRQD